METKLNTLRYFFENPNGEFQIRELSRLLKINHTTVRQHLLKLVKEGLIEAKKGKPYDYFKAIINVAFLNLKLYYNLEKLRKSNLVEQLEQEFAYPVMVLFGSYASATDDEQSDIDLCIISSIKKDLKFDSYEKILNRKISLHLFTKTEWKNTIAKNPSLINSICNGLVISGELEVL